MLLLPVSLNSVKRVPIFPRVAMSSIARAKPCIRFSGTLLGALLLLGVFLAPARAENPEHLLWGVMDWMTDPNKYPDTDTATTRPLYRDGNCRMITHQYQGPNWLAYKLSDANKNEIRRIYDAGSCIKLMLYFVSCTHDAATNTFGYPLNDQFLADYAELLEAYKVGGGPLYIDVFPEFEEWYRSRPSAEQDQYREKIRSQFAAMAQLTRSTYHRAYLGASFEGQSFAGDTSQFVTRWDPMLSKADFVSINCMSAWPQYWDQAIEMVKGTKLIAANWGLPIMLPFVELWADKNSPIFTTGDGNTYAEDAALFSDTILAWINSCLQAPEEIATGPTAAWRTNLRTLKSRGLFAFSLYSAPYSNKPTATDPDGVVHTLPSYSALTDLMRANGRTYLYPITEMEYSQAVNPPVASAAYRAEADTKCSSGGVVVLDAANASGQHFTYRVPVTRNGTYRVLVGIRKQADGGAFKLYVNGSARALGDERDCSLATGTGHYQEYDQGLVAFDGIARTKWTDFKFGVSRAGSGGGYKLAIDYIKLVPEVPETIPAAPAGLTATAATRGRVDLSWTATTGATGYEVGRASSSGGPFTLLASGLTSPSYSDTAVLDGATYYYRVQAANSAGTSADSATVVVTTAGATIEPAITSSAATIFTLGLPCRFTVTATGAPAPTFLAPDRPAWATFDATTGVLAGTPPAGTDAQFAFTITAGNGTMPDARQVFTLHVQAPPAATAPLVVSTLAGSPGVDGATNATGSAARFKYPLGVVSDRAGNLYVADSENHVIRKVTATGEVTTLAGLAGTRGCVDGTGTAATFNAPAGLALDGAGNLYVADTNNHTIRKIVLATAEATTLAGQSGASGSADGAGTAAQFNAPQDLAFHAGESGGNLYVADTSNHLVRKIALATVAVSTVAGQAGVAGCTDGTAASATFNFPSGIAARAEGALYVADTGNNAVREITADGTVRTLAGLAGSAGAADGVGANARFNDPSAIALDGAGANLYVLDTDSHTVRQIVIATGAVTTRAGQAGLSGSVDGSGELARFRFPSGVAQNPTGLVIADSANHTLRLALFPVAVAITTQPQSKSVTAGAPATFKVVASGQPEPVYQWYFNGTAIPSATTDTYTLANAQSTNAGNYSVVVANASGSVTSDAATLTVNAAASGGGSDGSEGGGGGGAPGAWFFLALGLLGTLRRWTKR